MNVRTTTADRLTSEELAAWSAIQRAEPVFASPYFRTEFTLAVAAVRDAVEVAVLEENGQPVGFFPYERLRWNRGAPVGTFMSDYHGVIARGDSLYDPVQLVRSCGLSSWRFNHLVSPRRSFMRCTYRHADSPYVDLSQGYEKYKRLLPPSFAANLRRRERKLEREIGPLRLELDTRDAAVFGRLIAWKVEQYQRTGVVNVLAIPWTLKLLERLLEFRGSDFAPVLSVLYAGDRVVAINYLLRAGSVLHSWFPAYDREASQYSPGLLLYTEILRNAASIGITRVDLGRGNEGYKKTLQNGATLLAEGAVDAVPVKGLMRRAWWAVRGRVRATPLRRLAKHAASRCYQLQLWFDSR